MNIGDNTVKEMLKDAEVEEIVLEPDLPHYSGGIQLNVKIHQSHLGSFRTVEEILDSHCKMPRERLPVLPKIP